MEIITNSAEETRSFAKKISKNLKPGNILSLYGSLGAGKTTFIQGLAQGLGFRQRVFSPTFVIARPYKIEQGNIKTLYHIDLYRLEGVGDIENTGIEELLLDKEAVSTIEWPEKIEKWLPKKAIKVRLETLGKEKRKITVDLPNSRL
ncbi:MAG: tRNA (adenosine(37)-N6)-threonylcarbamoyltransferase complex ATPase subunit type 1 TsaE [Candidatus Woykebacteria bacterium RBG_13_40_15]|uniref:tRNA threonylcarbamoyladenosine biosynthesis protein TsaE n=1 Tax=Candidatus Woykebacteria bacterium RBG_13_40_15 TaxID=1802593 RepID=A0A1G1W5K4_9BACT|nr:MAG: tRNA (adenosine(37)-N6)-threonylcarbamoyltransferase complex ATPase subunit type 1 TsaE [Candidatus Woykebacteria bacterium RBG_13_40_15]